MQPLRDVKTSSSDRCTNLCKRYKKRRMRTASMRHKLVERRASRSSRIAAYNLARCPLVCLERQSIEQHCQLRLGPSWQLAHCMACIEGLNLRLCEIYSTGGLPRAICTCTVFNMFVYECVDGRKVGTPEKARLLCQVVLLVCF